MSFYLLEGWIYAWRMELVRFKICHQSTEMGGGGAIKCPLANFSIGYIPDLAKVIG